MKFNKKWLAVLSVSALAFLGLGVGTANFTADTKTASAATIVDNTKRYITAGQTTRDGEVITTTTSLFRVSIIGGNGTTGGTETIQPGSVLNLASYNIVAERRYAWTDLSFQLYYNGRKVVDDTPTGTGTLTLYSGSMPNGSYEMVFGFTFASGSYAGVYVYRYQFVVNDGVPTGILQVDGQTVSSRSYTNKTVTYQVICDNFGRLYYKRPGATTYNSTVSSKFTVSATESNEGAWTFYGVDANGVESAKSYIYIDVTAPTGKLTKEDGTALGNGGYSNQPISFTATDNASLLQLEYKAPDATTWSTYTSGTLKSGAGWHTFRAVDRAGQYSEEYEVFYDNTAPTGRVVDANGKSIVNAGFTNAEYIQYTAGDSQSGISACYVKKPNSDYYSAYTSGSQLTVEGTYTFYCKNRSGMESTAITVTLDKTKPMVTILADGVAIQNGEMTNAQEISFSVNDVNGVSAIYVKTPSGEDYVDYTEGTSFTEEGQYSFYAVDISQNTSEIYTVTVDRSIPSAQLYVDEVAVGSGSYTNGGHIRFECDETCYQLVTDIDLGGIEWAPIGNNSAPFTGLIEGNGYTISNFKITLGESYIGLLGYNNGVIQNLDISNFTISVAYEGAIYGGALVGFNNGTIQNCAAIGNITATAKNDRCFLGGLIGYNTGNISYSRANGNVTANAHSTLTDQQVRACYTGLLTGYNTGDIECCYTEGALTSTGSSSASSIAVRAACYTGGLTGVNNGVISNSYSLTTINAAVFSSINLIGVCNSIYSDAYVGGLVGLNGGIIIDCYSIGNITVGNRHSGTRGTSSYNYSYIGGLVGYNTNDNSAINNCFSTGNIETTITVPNTQTYYCFIGGIVGKKDSIKNITNCFCKEGQSLSVTNGQTITTFTNTIEAKKTLAELQTVEFQVNQLKWDSEIWNVVEGQLPTLKNI